MKAFNIEAWSFASVVRSFFVIYIKIVVLGFGNLIKISIVGTRVRVARFDIDKILPF